MHAVAETILDQLGRNKFIAMTGAKNFVASSTALTFDLPRGAINKANKVRVTLTDCDTYRIAFYKWNARKLDMATIGEVEGVYADQLQEIFTHHTGLYTRL